MLCLLPICASPLPRARFFPQRILVTSSSLHSRTRFLYLSGAWKPRCGSLGAKLEVGCVHWGIIYLSSFLGTHLGPRRVRLDDRWAGTDREEPLGYRELVPGAASDLCCSHGPLLLHLGAPSCLVWLGRSEAGAGGQWATGTAPAGPRQAQTRWSGPAQSPAVCLNGLLVLCRKLPPALPARLREAGEREGSVPGPEPWLALQAVPALAQPSICDHLLPPRPSPSVFTASGPLAGLPSDLPGLQSLTFLGYPLASVHPGSSHPLPLPSRPLSILMPTVFFFF